MTSLCQKCEDAGLAVFSALFCAATQGKDREKLHESCFVAAVLSSAITMLL